MKGFSIVHKETKKVWKTPKQKHVWGSAGAAKNAWNYAHGSKESLLKDGVPVVETVNKFGRKEINYLFSEQDVYEIVELRQQIDEISVDRQKELEALVARYNKQVRENFYVQTEEGLIPRFEYYGTVRKVAQAACNFNGYIVTGTRHFCPLMNLQIDSVGREELYKFAGGREHVEQGFTDQWGVFLNRQDAYRVALAAGQIDLERHPDGERLFSESYI